MARKSKEDEAEEAFRKFARLWTGVDKGEIKREETDVGLYVAEYVTATGDAIPEYIRQYADRFNQSVDFDGYLLPIARDTAKAIIDLDESDDAVWSKTPAEIRQEAVRVARNIQTTIRCLENIQDRSDLADLPDELKEHYQHERQRKALAFAFQIGDAHRRLRMLIGPARYALLQRGVGARDAKSEATQARYSHAFKMLKAFCDHFGVDPVKRKGITQAKKETVKALRLGPTKRAKKYPFLSAELKKAKSDKKANTSLLNRAEKAVSLCQSESES